MKATDKPTRKSKVFLSLKVISLIISYKNYSRIRIFCLQLRAFQSVLARRERANIYIKYKHDLIFKKAIWWKSYNLV